MKNSKSINFFNDLRGKFFNEADLYELLTDFTSGKDYKYLKHFQNIYNNYLKEQMKILEDSFSEDDIKAEIKKRDLEGKPELKIGAISSIITNDEEKRKEKLKIKYEDRDNVEGLMFPEEFISLKKVKPLLEEIIALQKKEESNQITPHLNLIDLSDSSGTEKIIMLEKLGVLAFLKKQEPFKGSTNKLAIVVSGFTGIKSKTVQSYINPIFSNEADQKNNPLISEKTVNKVKIKLSNLGYNPSE